MLGREHILTSETCDPIESFKSIGPFKNGKSSETSESCKTKKPSETYKHADTSERIVNVVSQ